MFLLGRAPKVLRRSGVIFPGEKSPTMESSSGAFCR